MTEIYLFIFSAPGALFVFATPMGRRIIDVHKRDHERLRYAGFILGIFCALCALFVPPITAIRWVETTTTIRRLSASYQTFEAALSSPDPAVRTAIVGDIAAYEAERKELVYWEAYQLRIPASVHDLPDATELLLGIELYDP